MTGNWSCSNNPIQDQTSTSEELLFIDKFSFIASRKGLHILGISENAETFCYNMCVSQHSLLIAGPGAATICENLPFVFQKNLTVGSTLF
eukprot:c25752_g1_i1 orf=480-749(+)